MGEVEGGDGWGGNTVHWNRKLIITFLLKLRKGQSIPIRLRQPYLSLFDKYSTEESFINKFMLIRTANYGLLYLCMYVGIFIYYRSQK